MMFNIGKTPDYLNVFQIFCRKKSLKHCGTLWNNLPSHVKSQKSVMSLKNTVFQYILGNLHNVAQTKSVS